LKQEEEFKSKADHLEFLKYLDEMGILNKEEI